MEKQLVDVNTAMDFIKINNFYSGKNLVWKIKRQIAERKNILPNMYLIKD